MLTKGRATSLCLMLGAMTGLAACSASHEGDPSGDDTERESSAVDAVPKKNDAARKPGASSSSTQRLKKSLPQAHVSARGQRIQRIYGVVAEGSSPDAAAENFRQRGAKELGLSPQELVPVAPPAAAQIVGAPVTSPGAPASSASATGSTGLGLMFNPDTGTYKFKLYAYQQTRDGIPVYGGQLRTLVRVAGDNPVVWANTDLRPLGDFKAPAKIKTDTVDADKSLAALKAHPTLFARGLAAPTALERFSAPTATIFAGINDQFPAPRMALEYTAHDADSPRSFTFIADATTGDILHVESNQHYNIDGTVRAEVVAGVEAMQCGTLATEPLPHARVTSAVGDAVADENGAFTIVESGSGSVSVVSNVTGEYFDVTDLSGNPSSLSLTVTPPGPADFLHQDPASPPELVLAQTNAYKHANALRDLLIAHVPDYPVISTETGFQINVNASGDGPMDLCAQTGGGWYDGDRLPASINFCVANSERANSAMGSIIHHEYGHHIIDAGGSKQLQYGEGMSDTIAMLFSKDPAIGLGYHLDCNEPLRQANNDCQYSESDCSSCGAGIYECGALISGTVWDIWQQLEVTTPETADDLIRSLVFSSIPMHTGVSIDPSLAIDMLTLDDDDNLLENGTPHYQEICTGFGLHNMDCPPIVDGLVVQGADLEAGGPSDGPFEPASVSYTLHNLGPEETLSYAVQLPAGATWLSVDNPTGNVALGSQTTVTVSIDQAQAAALPNGRYTATVEFINVETGVGNASRSAALRVGAPEPIYTATFDDGLDGFVVDQSDYDNIWHQTTACVDELPGHSSPGSLYYGRDDQCNHSTSAPNRHWVTSPSIVIENPAIVDLGFNYYLRTERPGSDILEILMSINGGPFQIVASNGDEGEFLDETTAWEQRRFEISELLPSSGPVTIQLQLAFDAGSPGDNHETGFLIDDITVYAGTESSEGVLLPGRIEAEHYRRYNDTTAGNEGGGCDTGDDVDKEATGDTAGGGCNVGWTAAGEWLEYDVTVATAQSFDIVARVASQNAGKSFRMEVDGVDVTGALAVPANGWQNYSDVRAEGIPLAAGDHVVRLFMITDLINVNYIDFELSGSEPSCGDGTCSGTESCSTCAADCGTCGPSCGDGMCDASEDCSLCAADCGSCSGGVQVPALIQAEDYLRYNDTTSGNQGGGCDTGDDVDKEATGDSAGGGCNVGWTEPGEWLEYDITVATTQTFDIVTRVATANAGKSFRIEIDGVDVTGALSVPANGWQNYSDVTAPGVLLTAGTHVVRLFMITNYININYIDFQAAGSGPTCGDGTCNGSEGCDSCSQDCGSCSGSCTCPSGCSSVQSASVPFTSNGVTDACYFFTGNAGSHINSWNMTGVNLNGLNVTNTWVGSNNYPAPIGGGYYLYVDGDVGWSHVEVN